MEGDSELAVNQFGDASGGPEVGGKAVGSQLPRQALTHPLVLFGGQKPGPARRRQGSQSGVAPNPVSGHPFGDSDTVDTQGDGHSGLGASAQNQMNRPPPHGFQFGSSSFASHGEKVR